MVNGSVGVSGHTFDAFVSSQRTYNEPDWAAKIQEKYWQARQKFLAKVEKKEDSCIVLSDSKLDSKLEIYRSIDKSCDHLIDILESYQNCLVVFANEENALGILLKECGKHDRTKAGKIMSLTGKSLTQSSHQRIRLYMPLLRLCQEMETFHSRAVEDTSDTVRKLESRRSQYRSSLLWMKDISEKLNPDVYRQLDKFRRVQNKVREDKRAFDSVQMDVVQKVDLLMASRCNLMNQILAPYQAILLETFDKNHNNFTSVEEIIKNEDLYEYEFKTLKQLNPLRLTEEPPSHDDGCPSSTRAEDQSKNANLIGDLDDGAKDCNDNNNNLQSEGSQSNNLIDVNTQPDNMRTSDNTLLGVESLVTLDEHREDELAKSLDLLDTLFGSSHDASELENEPASNCASKTRKCDADVRALRSNLNANLLDCDDGGEEEAKQVASLLGLSERASPCNKNKDDANALGLLQEDIFTRWAVDAGRTDDEANEKKQGGNTTIDNLDQDLMDIGGATMPKASSGGLEDFLA